MAAEDAPVSTAVGGLKQAALQPGLLTASHQTTTGVIFDLADIVSVIVGIRNRAVVLSCVQHNQVHQFSKLEVSPDAKVIVHLDLSKLNQCVRNLTQFSQTTYLMGIHSK